MTARTRIVIASAAAVAAGAALLPALLSGKTAAPPERADRPLGVRVGCDSQSGAGFPGAYSSRRNLVVGPLALIGAATLTDEATAREHGGNKFPLVVRAGHTVTVSVPDRHRATAGLTYSTGLGSLRRHTITFTACPPGRSQSRADGRAVTFWSGFVLTTVPSCVPLDVWVDQEPRRSVGVALGRRCGAGGTRAPQAPLRDCATRAEGGSPDDGRSHPGEVALGPLRFAGLARLATRRALGFDRVAGVHRVKVGISVPAGVRVTLSIGATARDWRRSPTRPGDRASQPTPQASPLSASRPAPPTSRRSATTAWSAL